MRLPSNESENAGPNLTPVIDIVFLLLIFFLVATTFERQEKLVSINLAEILQAKPLAEGAQEIVVNIDQNGEYIVMKQQLSEQNLIDMLHTAAVKNPTTRVQIRADENVKFRFPLTVIGICKREDLGYSCTVLEKRTG
jgi:biopolymer transport protein ExbD